MGVHQLLIFAGQTLPEGVLNNAADGLIAKTRERLQQLIQTGGDVKAQLSLLFFGHFICLAIAQRFYPNNLTQPDRRFLPFDFSSFAELPNLLYIESGATL